MSGPTTPFARFFVTFVVLPLLFIAGVQLFVLSAQTDYYFAWTIALPLKPLSWAPDIGPR